MIGACGPLVIVPAARGKHWGSISSYMHFICGPLVFNVDHFSSISALSIVESHLQTSKQSMGRGGVTWDFPHIGLHFSRSGIDILQFVEKA